MNKKGFTLVELLAVIVILAIVLIIAVPNIFNIITKTKKDALDIDAANIARNLDAKVLTGEVDIATFTKEDLDSIGVDSTKYEGFGVSLVNGKVVVSLAKDNYIGENRLDSKVYGIIFNDSNGDITRTDDSIGLITTATATSITSDFDNEEIYGEISEEVDTYGNVFIKIPKFWIKKTKKGNVWTYQISRTKQDSSYYLPACFYDETSGKIVSYILVGKYEASLGAGDKLESKSGKAPLVSKTITAFRGYAGNNNILGEIEGYQQLDIHAVDILQTLFYVEFATFHSQSIMAGFTSGQYTATHLVSSASNKVITFQTAGHAGNYRVGQTIDVGSSQGGRQRLTDARIVTVDTTNNKITYEVVPGITQEKQTIISGDMVYNVGYLTGTTDSVGNNLSSGSPTSNSDGKYAMKYRGIENVWGNIYKFVDGVNINEHQAYVSRNATTYKIDKYDEDYVSLSYKNHNANGTVTKMGYDPNNPFIQMPISVTGTGYYQDYYYQATSKRIVIFGGAWYGGSYAGMS